MINIISEENLKEINNHNLEHVIRYIFNDYQDITESYLELLNALRGEPLLQDKLRVEICSLMEGLNSLEGGLTEKDEETIIDKIKAIFEENNKEIESMMIKMMIQKMEDTDKQNEKTIVFEY